MATSVSEASSLPTEDKFQIRPSFKNSLNPRAIRELMQTVLNSRLSGKEYDPNESSNWSRDLATEIKTKLKESHTHTPRYKFLVQIILGEKRGAGIRCGCRCLWDQQTDKVAEAVFQNVSSNYASINLSIYQYPILYESLNTSISP
jgi:hypothetical protein